MPLRRTALALVTLLVAATTTAAAQQAPAPQAPAQRDSARAQIQRTLRAFYFNLAHHDWEALTADILPAKVVAAEECASTATRSIDRATITLDGDWAEVSVPRCTEPRGADEFRLIRFDGRWRFVHIELWLNRRRPEPPAG